MTTPNLQPAWPPTPRDRFSGWGARRAARTSGWVLGILIALPVVIIWNLFVTALPEIFPTDREGDFVYTRYNDALVAGDTASAWGLGCVEDSERLSLSDFEGNFKGASGELGGLNSWQRLRGGPRWIGQDKNVLRRPNIEKVDGHSCVHFSDNPLGDPF